MSKCIKIIFIYSVTALFEQNSQLGLSRSNYFGYVKKQDLKDEVIS